MAAFQSGTHFNSLYGADAFISKPVILVLNSQDWEDLLYSIKKKKCTPFVGAGAAAPWIPLGRDIAGEWTKEYDYPLDDSSQLSRVAQFMAIADGSELTPKNNLSRKLERITIPNFSLEKYRNTPYAILADLNLPIYITTNYDHFLEQALKSRGKQPISEFCAWNESLKNYMNDLEIPTALNKQFSPDEARPLVYHLHGDLNEPSSMVLNENDYIDFLISLSRDNGIVPSAIHKALANATLLMMGYSLEDMTFRVILKSTNLSDKRGIAILRPPQHLAIDIEKYQKYLDQYTNHMFKIHVYWGDASEFSRELRSRWDRFMLDN